MREIRYGILGTASIAPRFMRGVELSNHGKLSALSARNMEKAKAVAETFHIEKIYEHYEDMLLDKDIDVIYIPTPNDLHPIHTMQALKAGKHVVCEKPFTLQQEQATAIFTYAKEHGLFVMEAQKSVFLPITNWLKQAIQDKVIGEISFVQLSSYYAEGDHNHWMYAHKRGGGVFYGSGSYTIEYMKYLFDKPILSSQGTALIGPTGVDEIGTINLNINNEHLITTTISRWAPLPQEAVFYGSKGNIRVPYYWRPKQAILTKGDKEEIIEMPFENEFVYEVNHVNECIEKGYTESPVMSAAMTLDCIQIIEGIVQKGYK